MTDKNPGVYAGIPNAEYHGGPGISKSGLDLIARSPLHYRASRDAANDNEQTAAMRIGTAAHPLILEPDLFVGGYALPFVPAPGALATIDQIKERLRDAGEKVSGRKDELIERLRAVDPDEVFLDDLRTEYDAENQGREILTPTEWDQLHAMRDAVMAHPGARALLTGAPGVTELSAYWRDQETGALCRCRPDFWRADGVLVDLKTTDDASPEGFARSIQKYRYHVQAPFYLDGCRAAMQAHDGPIPGMPDPEQGEGHIATPSAFVFIAVEKKAPHAVAVYALDFDSVELGRAQYRADLATFAQCHQAGDWPGYGDTIQKLGVPDWYLRRNSEGGAA